MAPVRMQRVRILNAVKKQRDKEEEQAVQGELAQAAGVDDDDANEDSFEIKPVAEWARKDVAAWLESVSRRFSPGATRSLNSGGRADAAGGRLRRP